MVLSKRLQALADMVTPGHCVADVGCDHGFVAIYLVEEKICPRVIAMDVNKGPLQRAREHIVSHALERYIDTRLSDGLEALEVGEVQTMLCAGMGGRLMQGILTRGKEKARAMEELILQPQSEISAFRCFLRQAGYGIIEEKMILEDGKFYPMMRVVPGLVVQEPGSLQKQRLEDKFGRYLLERKDPILAQFLQFQLHTYEEILGKIRENRGSCPEEAGVLSEIEDMQAALSLMEGG